MPPIVGIDGPVGGVGVKSSSVEQAATSNKGSKQSNRGIKGSQQRLAPDIVSLIRGKGEVAQQEDEWRDESPKRNGEVAIEGALGGGGYA